MNAIAKYFPVVPFIMQHKVVLTFESVKKILKCNIQMKAIKRFFCVVFLVFKFSEFFFCGNCPNVQSFKFVEILFMIKQQHSANPLLNVDINTE